MRVALRCLLTIVLCLAALPAPLTAQEGTGAINGRVADTSAAVMPGVSVTLSSPAVMGTREYVTDERGTYRFSQLPPGMYSLKFELPGFKTLIREGIRISAGFTATVNADLEVATLSETVTVTGQSPVVDLQSSTLAVNFTSDLLTNLPNGRDIWSTLGQTPGVMMTKFDVGGSQAGQMSGFRTYGTDGQDVLLLDGVRYSASYLDYGSYEEMQVVTASKGAEMRVAGSYVNSIVKSGSNDIHGMVYDATSPKSFQGSNLNDRLRRFGLTTTSKMSLYSDLNGNVGGPIKKDKVWWFLSMRDNYIGRQSLGFKKGACVKATGCTGEPIGTFVNDNPSTEDGPFYTRLDNVTLKVNSQVTPSNQIVFTGNFADKRMPFRGGDGPNALFFNTDSVTRQTYPGRIYKVQWTSVLNNRITLDNSFNKFGWNWPNNRRIDEYSRRDLDTQQVRGGFSGEGTGFTLSTPNTRDPVSRHFNSTASLVTDRFLTGTHNFKVGYVITHVRARQTHSGTIGQIILYYRDGFRTPAFIETLDAPFTLESSMKEHAFFINDAWSLARRLTLNVGFRIDRATPYYPRQEKTGTGPYQSQQVVERRVFPSLSGPVPRFSLIYDVFGNGRTALKASYGRYTFEVGGGSSSGLSSDANPMALTVSRYNWDGTFPAANCYLTNCAFNPAGRTPVSVAGGRNRDIDPNLKFAYSDEYTAGLDQELMTDVSLRLNFVRKFEQNRHQTFNVAIPYNAYNIPVSGVDPGVDGRTGTADDRNVTLFSLDPTFVGRRRDFISNNAAFDHANTSLEAALIKRLSNNWQVITGWNYLRRKVWGAAGIPEDPNTLKYNAGENFNTWSYKVMGTYEAPFGLSLSSVFRTQKGEAYGRRWNSPRMNQGVQVLFVDPKGTYFMDTIKLFDVRVEKNFTISERWGKVSAVFDLFNVLNSAAVTGINDLTGANFQAPTQTVEPRIGRIAVRFTF